MKDVLQLKLNQVPYFMANIEIINRVNELNYFERQGKLNILVLP